MSRIVRQLSMLAFKPLSSPIRKISLKSWVFMPKYSQPKRLNINQSFKNLFEKQIKKALNTSEDWGARSANRKSLAGNNPYGTASAEPLLDFTMRPYCCQDVAWGTCTLKLKSGDEFVTPNVVRTVAKCTIINYTWSLQRSWISTDE